jgi:alkanesulfonate monooxygenase SsuD/methylene tetrahydromethanopterin reductase-like flavin-dependent oxidoreductase (luciferase family)
MADGLIVAALSESQTVEARRELARGAIESGRDPAALGLHFQIWLSFGKDRGEAEARLRRSQHFRRMVARHPTHSEEAVLAEYRAGNLFGAPEDVIGQLRRFERGGVDHVGVVFLGETMDQLLADMQLFAERVMPAFASGDPP